MFKWGKGDGREGRHKQPWTPKEAEAVLARGTFRVELKTVQNTHYLGAGNETAKQLLALRTDDGSLDTDQLGDLKELDLDGSLSMSCTGIEWNTGRKTYVSLSCLTGQDAIYRISMLGGIGDAAFLQSSPMGSMLHIEMLTSNPTLILGICLLLQQQIRSGEKAHLEFVLADRSSITYKSLQHVPASVPLMGMKFTTDHILP